VRSPPLHRRSGSEPLAKATGRAPASVSIPLAAATRAASGASAGPRRPVRSGTSLRNQGERDGGERDAPQEDAVQGVRKGVEEPVVYRRGQALGLGRIEMHPTRGVELRRGGGR